MSAVGVFATTGNARAVVATVEIVGGERVTGGRDPDGV